MCELPSSRQAAADMLRVSQILVRQTKMDVLRRQRGYPVAQALVLRRYCDRDCQKAHWGKHKATCKAMGEVISCLIDNIKKAGSPVASYKALYEVIMMDFQVARMLKGSLFTATSAQMMQCTVCCHVCFRIR